MIACSGEFDVVGEPFIDLYKRALISAEKRQLVLADFKQVCDDLLARSLTKPVFVKDMGYHAIPFINDDFIKSVNNTFLIRDPNLSIPSLYKMRADYAEKETGFEGQYELFKRVCDVTGEVPFVVDGELLKKFSEAIVNDYFSYIGQQMPTGILSWPVGSRDDWAGREPWHVDAINSQGFEDFSAPEKIDKLPLKVMKSIERNMFYYQEMYKNIDILVEPNKDG
jgi:hypothetical protein